MEKQYYVYILGNDRPTLYIGVTSNLAKRITEHKSGTVPGFTQKYQLKKLLYAEIYSNVIEALYREKQLKHWNRQFKLDLISQQNPDSIDLSHRF